MTAKHCTLIPKLAASPLQILTHSGGPEVALKCAGPAAVTAEWGVEWQEMVNTCMAMRY